MYYKFPSFVRELVPEINNIGSKLFEKYDIVLLDINNLFIRSYCKLSTTTEQGENIAGLYGTINIISSIINKFSPSVVIAVYDGKGGSSHKRKIIKDYKSNRKLPKSSNLPLGISEKEAEENFSNQLKKVYQHLSLLPIIQIICQGYECDEILAYVVKNKFQNKSKLIVSSDKDYYQLIDENTKVYSHSSGKVIVENSVIEEFGCLANSVSIVKSIIPDKSDNIKSLSKLNSDISRIGIKTIEKIFHDYLQQEDTNIDEFLELCYEKSETEEDEKIRKHCFDLYKLKDEIKKRYEIVQLQDVDISLNAIGNIGDSFSNFIKNYRGYDNFVVEKNLHENSVPILQKDFGRWRQRFMRLNNSAKTFLKENM